MISQFILLLYSIFLWRIVSPGNPLTSAIFCSQFFFFFFLQADLVTMLNNLSGKRAHICLVVIQLGLPVYL